MARIQAKPSLAKQGSCEAVWVVIENMEDDDVLHIGKELDRLIASTKQRSDAVAEAFTYSVKRRRHPKANPSDIQHDLQSLLADKGSLGS